PQANGRSIPVTPPEVPSPSAMESPALKIFLADCANCHGANGSGGTLGPSLINIAKRRNLNFTSLTRWIAGHGRETAADSMPKFRQLTQDERNQIADWLLKLDKPLVLVEATPSQMSPSTPPKSFTTECAVCHGDQAEGAIGPPLQGVTSKPNRTEADLAKILDNSRSYGLKDPMPASFPKLAAGDKAEIVHWLATLR
ncbi:MAG TPA: cytochrome c, partial [Blastocatellia bacterium]|nr:cytochrome c [Blastocatellia bacterium]